MSSSKPEGIDVAGLFAATLREVLPDKQLPAIDNKTVIADLGVDSISLMEVIGVLEDGVGVTLADEEITKIRTVGDIGQIIDRKQKTRQRHTE